MLIKELKEARRSSGLSEAMLAARINVKPQVIKRLEAGNGSVTTLVATKAALDFQLNGKLVLPDHKLIRPEWHRHVPYLFYTLERDQRLIRDELKAFAKHIGSYQYDANSDYAKFSFKVFADQPEVVNALNEKQLARQRAFAASQTFQLS